MAELEPFSGQYERIPGRGDYSGLWMPGRSFRNPKLVEMRNMPPDFLRASQTTLAMVQLTNETRESLYSIYYGTYVTGNSYTAEINTRKRQFTEYDAVVLPALARMISLNIDALAEGFKPAISLQEAAFTESDTFLDLKINVNSPGYFSFADDSIKPIVFAVIFALAATVGASAQDVAKKGQIAIVNTVDQDYNACLHEAQEEANKLLRQMGERDFKEVCDRVRSLVERTGAESDVKVSPKP